MRPGFLSLLILIITAAIIAFLFILTNQLRQKNSSNELDAITAPGRIKETQNTVNEFQQKSIDRQTIDVK